MANIKLPERFRKKLDSNQRLDGIVKTTLSTFGDILEENKLYFFPEYTDHGIKHIESVIFSADNLIKEQTFNEILNDSDIGMFILSVILHDVGMHIDINGFECLLEGKFDDIRNLEFDDSTWSELWDDYFNEAKKFSGKELKSIFGSEDTIIIPPNFADHGKIDENAKKLIGEFIRRNHARLAHEIALMGLPGKPEYLEFGIGLDEKWSNLVGLIARSHGLELRTCLDYIENTFGHDVRRTPLGIHAIFLMILLRIADYIQIDSSRTSKNTLKIRTFSSPISTLEHKTHLSIDNIDFSYQDDPERIYVNASPENSLVYVKLKRIVEAIQQEFDKSWAVLGELYGNINSPEIKYRRIKSNLDDLNFISKQNYLTDIFSFKANDEIMKLLIAPLYGEDPKYGIRELIQNAVDACKERNVIEIKDGNKDYKPLIKIELFWDENKNESFSITDNGIGMDSTVIGNYFLRAGASYRKSTEWQKEFIDKDGNIIVRRSGRFGVGILGAFLLGNTIDVETRKKNEPFGYKFSGDLNTEQFNIIKETNIPEGTKIKIVLNKGSLKKINSKDHSSSHIEWNEWYTLSKPNVRFFYFGREIPNKYSNPDINEELPLDWNAIDSEGFDKIMWRYKFDSLKANIFACNGIIISKVGESIKDYLDLGRIVKQPEINVFDSNAFLPLSLDRNSVTTKLSFSNDLLIDIYKDFIAYLLVYKDCGAVEENSVQFNKQLLDYPGISNSYYPYRDNSRFGFQLYDQEYYYCGNMRLMLQNILISRKGYILNYSYFIKKLKKIEAIFIQMEDALSNKKFEEIELQDKFLLVSREKLNSIGDYANALDNRTLYYNYNKYDKNPAIVHLKTEKYNYLFKGDKKRLNNYFLTKYKRVFENFGWTRLTIDETKDSIINLSFLEKYQKEINFIREYDIVIHNEIRNILSDPVLDQLLEKYLGDDVTIPYDIAERRNKYPLAFEELERYMKKYFIE